MTNGRKATQLEGGIIPKYVSFAVTKKLPAERESGRRKFSQ
jgi:hypothetical protein